MHVHALDQVAPLLLTLLIKRRGVSFHRWMEKQNANALKKRKKAEIKRISTLVC
jgi:hypothetical protein